MKAFSGASVASAAVLALSMSVGCSQVGQVQAKRSFKAANAAYQAQDYKKAAGLYEETIKEDPNLAVAYFFLGNSYDNMFRPSKKGEPENDALLQKAVDNYTLCAEKLGNSQLEDERKLAKLSLEYLVAAYGADKLNDPAKAEPVLIKMIQMEPQEPSNYAVLAKIYEDAGLYDDAEKVLLMGKEAKPKDASVYMQLAGFYNRQGRFDKTIESLNQRAEIEPNNPEAFQTIAGYYWDETRGDAGLTEAQKKEYITKGLEAVDKAISLKSDYVEAITFRGLLLRLQANVEKDPSKQQALLKEATALSDKANELRKKAAGGN
ncbi:MAG: tetratricopeptide repeat protein [Acidobacteria bacterium]|nr:tetratricopeptide repeat protein [Acidobacteriota bacterium]